MAAEPFNLKDREANESASPYLLGYPDVYGEEANPKTSPYYWWFMYLKRHEGYKACCESGGAGEYAALYADWGDVRVDDFEAWFFEYGDRLFREPHVRDDLGEITEVFQLAEVNLQDTMVVAIPFRIKHRSLTRNEILQQFLMLLDAKFPDNNAARFKAGRPPFKSEAKYRFEGYPQLAKLEQRLCIYDAVVANPELPYWKVGEELALNGNFQKGMKYVTNSKEQGEFGFEKRNKMTALIGNSYRKANEQIEKSVKNVFKVF